VEKYIVRKSGPLRGEVSISGAKNAVLPIMAAALLSDEDCVINDAPALLDVDILCRLLETLGAVVRKDLQDNVVTINSADISSVEASSKLVKQMRASILVMGPLLARKGEAVIPLPGGCAIGDRPVELHFKGLRALGADIRVSITGIVKAKAEKLKVPIYTWIFRVSGQLKTS